MDVEDEPPVWLVLWLDSRQRRYVDSAEPRIRGNPIAIFYTVTEIDGFAIDQQEVDFGVGHAERLDHVFDRSSLIERPLETAPAARIDQIFEITVEPEERMHTRLLRFPGRYASGSQGAPRNNRCADAAPTGAAGLQIRTRGPAFGTLGSMNTSVEAALGIAARLIAASGRTMFFTGAGVSTESGIPDFRGPQGLWKTVDPKLFAIQNYVADADVRRLSWRSRLDGGLFTATPNPSHEAVVRLEKMGLAPVVVTQNIDGLHQSAGSTDVIEMHGTVRDVLCLDCGDRGAAQSTFDRVRAGDDDPTCLLCGGILKVATISFGQQLDPDVTHRAFAEADLADVCVAAGSSLSVMPAADVPARVAQRGMKLVIVNAEPTELDRAASAIVTAKTGFALPELADRVESLLGQ